MDIWQVQKKFSAFEEGSLLRMVFEAIYGAVWLLAEMAEYLLVWFCFYPVLFFGSTFMLHVFYQIPLEYANFDYWANLMLTLAAVFFFGHRLLIRYVTTSHQSAEYLASRPAIRLELLLFLAVNFISYYTMKIPVNYLITREPMVRIGFWVFYAIYVPGIISIKYYYDKYLR
ncbi:MAG: hypothetical protein ACOYXC_04760 [Candidatus Rifleibacteriota bacterium]